MARAKELYQPYVDQARCLREVKRARDAGRKKALVVMASGLGKTVVSGFDVRRFLRSHKGARVLYLCHQNEILEQAKNEFERHILPDYCTYGFFHGGERDIHEVTVLFASFQTMARHREEFRRREFDYIVVDESHHSPAVTYLPTLKYFQAKFVLAITATPDRMDLQDIRDIYGKEVYNMPLEVALREGLLTPVDYRVMTDELHYKRVLDTPIGKLSIRQLNKLIFIKRRDDEIVRLIQERISEVRRPRMVIFCPRTVYCDQLAPKIPGALPIHSRLSIREQRERLQAFREGKLNTILTVDKFNEGIDIPDANVIVFLRSTASRTIFFQQLGRGLRQKKGKKQVLVLDFVASWERLATIDYLWRTAQKGGPSGPTEEPVVVQGGHFEFTEAARDVLDLIERIKGGYTREELIQQLQDLGEKLGHQPMLKDVADASRLAQTAPPHSFYKLFGSFSKALLAAGFKPNRYGDWSDQEILDQLGSLYAELKRPLLTHDVTVASRAKKIVSLPLILRRFGSFNNALRLAGLPVRGKDYRRRTSAEMLSDLNHLADLLGRVPRYSDIQRASTQGLCAGTTVYTKRFESIDKALKKAGLTVVSRQAKTPEEMLKQLRQFSRYLGRVPSQADIAIYARENRTPSNAVIRRTFGTLTSALVAAGLKEVHEKPTKEVLKAELVALSKDLGRVPSQRDVNSAANTGKVHRSHIYAAEFGTLTEAVIASGLRPRKTRAYLIAYLKDLQIKLGRPPTFVDVDADRRENGGPGTRPYIKIFGTFTEAKLRAGIQTVVRRRMSTKKDVTLGLRELAKKLGRTPTSAEAFEQVAPSSAFKAFFGSYTAAVKAVGLKPLSRKWYDRDELIAHIKKQAKELGRTPRLRDIKEVEGPGAMAYKSTFGSWSNALKAAGYEPDGRGYYPRKPKK